jgi:hypothetical protein
MKIHIKTFALTCSLVWGFGLFFLTWWLLLFKELTNQKTFIGRIYRGYTVSPKGSFIGMIWALADGFGGGLIFAWIYNLLLPKCDHHHIHGEHTGS